MRYSVGAHGPALGADTCLVQSARCTGSRAVMQVTARPRTAQGEGGAAVVRRPADRQWRRPAGGRKRVGLRGEAARTRPRRAGRRHAWVGGASSGWHNKDIVDPLVLMQRWGFELLEVLVAAPCSAVFPGP